MWHSKKYLWHHTQIFNPKKFAYSILEHTVAYIRSLPKRPRSQFCCIMPNAQITFRGELLLLGIENCTLSSQTSDSNRQISNHFRWTPFILVRSASLVYTYNVLVRSTAKISHAHFLGPVRFFGTVFWREISVNPIWLKVRLSWCLSHANLWLKLPKLSWCKSECLKRPKQYIHELGKLYKWVILTF